uniref:Methyltransf_21 domain-containing protein n=1 Tax=Caenorhabditis tropicalis TaxID=1561998 RepID=A0A1I7TCD5_9PELO
MIILEQQTINYSIQFWKQFGTLSRKCDEESQISKLGLIEIDNMDEQKVVILPKNISGCPQFSGEYIDQNVAHVDILYFLKEILNVQKIDNLWIDAEGAEYELFEIFEKNGILDQNEIVLCQANMEIHISEPIGNETNPNFEKQKIFMDFVKKMISERKYGIFHAVEDSHMRIFLFNFESEYCRNKF